MPRGRPKGTPRTGGRVKGTFNKVTRDIRELAGVYTVEALETLAGIMRTSEADQARVSAARELLDRAHGRAPQAITGEGGGPMGMVLQVVTGVDRGDAEE